MLRLVSEFEPEPKFLLLCDDVRCGTSAIGPVDRSSPEAVMQSKRDFLQRAIASGWQLDLMMSLCPGHVEKSRQRSHRVVIPTPVVRN